jgi:hypothetical protein
MHFADSRALPYSLVLADGFGRRPLRAPFSIRLLEGGSPNRASWTRSRVCSRRLNFGLTTKVIGVLATHHGHDLLPAVIPILSRRWATSLSSISLRRPPSWGRLRS